MHILVCVGPLTGDLNPLDASALEAALRIPDAQITVLSMGRPDAADRLRSLTRLGIGRAVLLTDPAFAGADTLATAYALSLAADRLAPDLILCGRQSLVGDTAQVGPMLAAMKNWPVLTHVLSLDTGGGQARCVTRLGEETAPLPCVLTMERLYPLRFPRIGSRPGEVEVWSAQDIGADPARCGLPGSPTRVLKTYAGTAGRRTCRFLPLAELDAAIQDALHHTHTRQEPPPAEKKLPEAWCVGPEPAAMARRVAERIQLLAREEPHALAAAIRAGNPAAVLWPADLWGRRTAPQVAARLQTGLCADCTALDTDAQQLFMIRPAMGGATMARIVCRTRPAMATVRLPNQTSGGVVVAVGAGAAAQLDSIRAWAEARGYTMAASRKLVDQGLAPYEQQVGLTGKTAAPAVYLAIGISGAVQHTCAVEGAGTILAVNPDKKARIFEYADVGFPVEWPG